MTVAALIERLTWEAVPLPLGLASPVEVGVSTAEGIDASPTVEVETLTAVCTWPARREERSIVVLGCCDAPPPDPEPGEGRRGR